VTRPKSRRQHLLAPCSEDFAVHRSVEQHRGDEAAKRQAADEGDCLPMSMRNGGVAALASRCPTAQADHFGRKPAFIDEDQVLGGELRLAVEPPLAGRLYVGPFLLTGVRSLFLCVWP
jgi:hypothetical protein